MSDFPILTIITLLPLIVGLIIVGIGKERKNLARGLALVSSFVSVALVLGLWIHFNAASGDLQFTEQHEWIPTLGVQYFVGVDGLGFLMVLLTTIVVPLVLLASWHLGGASSTSSQTSSGKDEAAVERVPPSAPSSSLFFSLILFLQAGLFGTFTALNFFHWFLFWELSLIPAFFLVRLWGGPRRAPAATQFFIYTMVGSVAMLLAFLGIYLATGTFDFIRLAELGRTGELASALNVKLGWYSLTREQLPLVVFAGVFLGVAVKVPLMPFHTWLPTTYAEAPTPVTMLLTGVMSKMGVYGFLRLLLPLFPEQMRMILTPLLWLAVITIVFSACAAFAQKDLKRMLAYSSINHLGYCLLAVFAVARYTGNDAALATEKSAALNGVFLQMFNHGLTAAALFMFVGFLEQRSGGLRGLNDFGGLRKVAPVFCGLMGIALFSSLGLPGLNGFVGEFLIFKGVFPLVPWAAGLSVLGLLVTAIFILTILQRVFNGPLNEKWSKFPDLTLCERLLVAAPIALMFALGVWPRLVLDVINATVVQMVEQLKF